MKTKTIINVLKFIRSTCESKKKCDTCPFSDSRFNCNLSEHLAYFCPEHWDIEALEKNFKDIERI